MKVYAVCSKLPTCRLVKMHNGKPFRYCIIKVASEINKLKETREIKGKPIKVEWVS